MTIKSCSNGKTIEIGGWTLYKYNGSNNTVRGRVNILRANSKDLVVDGVLNIPAKIGKYKIYGFGRPGNGMFGSDAGADFDISTDAVSSITRISLAETLFVDGHFYGNFGRLFGADATVFVEFLSNTFENIYSVGGGGVAVVCVIPDDTTQKFVEVHPNILLHPESFIEKSEFLKGYHNG